VPDLGGANKQTRLRYRRRLRNTGSPAFEVVKYISDLIPGERALARVSKDGCESVRRVHPSKRLRSLASGRAEPVIGRAFARPVGEVGILHRLFSG
jgi:hypothetical protein